MRIITTSNVLLSDINKNNIDIVKYCQYCFGFEMPSELSVLVNSTKKSLIVATRLWLDSAKFKVNSVNDVIS